MIKVFFVNNQTWDHREFEFGDEALAFVKRVGFEATMWVGTRLYASYHPLNGVQFG